VFCYELPEEEPAEMPEKGADSESTEASAEEVFAAAEHSSEFFFANDKNRLEKPTK